MKYVWFDYLDNQAKRTQGRIAKKLLKKYWKAKYRCLYGSDYNLCIIERLEDTRSILINEKKFKEINKKLYEDWIYNYNQD